MAKTKSENKVAFEPEVLKNLQPKKGEAATIYWSDQIRGLGVRVSIGRGGVINRKLFLQVRTASGAQRKLRLGDVSAVARNRRELEDTIGRAVALKREATAGRDPKVVHEAEKAAAKRAKAEAITFREYAEKYIEEVAPAKYADGGKMAKRCLERAITAFGHLPLAAVETEHVEALRDRIAKDKDHGPYAANRTVSHIGALYTEARKQKLVGSGVAPARGIEKTPDVPREAVLSPSEAKAFMAGIAAWEQEMAKKPRRGFDPTIYGDCLRLALFTGCRSGEAKGMRWDEVDARPGEWHRAAVRNKNRIASKTVLPGPAMAVIERARRRRAENPWMQTGRFAAFVFPSVKSPEGHIGELRGVFHGAIKAAGLEATGVTIHDLRATAVTLMLTPPEDGGMGLELEAVVDMLGSKDEVLVNTVYRRMKDRARARRTAEAVGGFWEVQA